MSRAYASRRRSTPNRWRKAWKRDMWSGSGHDALNGGKDALEAHAFLPELPAAGGRDCVVARAPFCRGLTPLGRQPSFVLKALECRIQRPLLDAEDTVREASDVLS